MVEVLSGINKITNIRTMAYELTEVEKRYQQWLLSRKPTNPLFLEVLERIAKEGKAPQGGLLEAALDTTEEIVESYEYHHRNFNRKPDDKDEETS